MSVSAATGQINAYKPAFGDPSDRFTVSAYAKLTSLPAPTVRHDANGIAVSAPAGVNSLLVRVPKGVNLVVNSAKGDVSVTDISGNPIVHAGRGDVRIMVEGYAQASTDVGGLNVTLGATSWPGTLTFSTGRGDIEVYIKQIAKFRVHLHTDDGMLFTDFGLSGTSHGSAETIDGVVNGGSNAGTIDIEAHTGNIRLLALTPQS